MKHDELGDRMKSYEAIYNVRLLPKLPTFARMDGRAFHTATRNLRKPYDEDMLACMIGTMRYLMLEFSAEIGYTQSDEITLLLRDTNLFDGRVLKLVSVLAAATTAKFNSYGLKMAVELPTFDARVWQTPEDEVNNVFIWRELDARRNAISALAHSVFGQSALHNKSRAEMLEMLHAVGEGFQDHWYPEEFRVGARLGWTVVEHYFSAEEIMRLPPLHEARLHPEKPYTRRAFLSLAPLTKGVI